jgi:hypothetical protein
MSEQLATLTEKMAVGNVQPVGMDELLADMVAKGDIVIESTPITFSNYRVRYIGPTRPEHTFEPRCWIEADCSEHGSVRVFDVPDADEGQQAIAQYACKAMNSHNTLIAALKNIRDHVRAANCSDGEIFVDEVEVLNLCDDALEGLLDWKNANESTEQDDGNYDEVRDRL